MLLKHPDQYKDEELEAWVRHLVDKSVSEGPRLDYKATISLSGDKQRDEAAKDISSFANEIGGTLIYGIPEDRQSDEVAIPGKHYGIDPVPDLESKLENIYVDSISPRLPEWCIKEVKLTAYENKVVYVVWTPESWLGPHMIYAYGDKRYYRRGQLRAVPMEEHEVRQRYERLRSLTNATEDFLNSPQLNYIVQFFPNDKFVSHYLVCPYYLLADRVDFGTTKVRQWLKTNVLDGHWVPSAQGVRTDLTPQALNWRCSEIYRNGAISWWRKTAIGSKVEPQESVFAYTTEFEEIQKFISLTRGFYELIGYFGPLQFQIKILNQSKSNLCLPPGNQRFDYLKLVTHDSNLDIRVVESSGKLFENSNVILERIKAEIFRAFGVWGSE